MAIGKYWAEFDVQGNRLSGFLEDLPYSAEEIQQKYPEAIPLSEEEAALYTAISSAVAPYGYYRHPVTGVATVRPKPLPTLEQAKFAKNEEVDRSAGLAYTGGFVSSANGEEMYYDSDTDTQNLIAGIYQQTKESDWDTLVRYPGVAPAGVAPMRARASIGGVKSVLFLNGAQIKQLVDDLSASLFATKIKVWGKKAIVDTAATVEEVEAIDPTI